MWDVEGPSVGKPDVASDNSDYFWRKLQMIYLGVQSLTKLPTVQHPLRKLT